MQAFLTALQFLTIFPIQTNAYPEVKTQAQSFLYYPLVGLIIGAILWLGLELCKATHLSSELIAAIVLTLWVVITGGLHLDGLADFFDGVMGGLGDKEKTLKIMRDSQIGAMGCIALILLLLLKWSALVQLISEGFSTWLLILSPFIARTCVLGLFIVNQYIRTDGIVSELQLELNHKMMITVMMASSLLIGLYSISLLLVIFLVFFLINALFTRILGGVSGDCCGAMIEILEVAALLVVV